MRRRFNAGSVAVEFAVAIPFVLVLLAGLIDTAFLVRAKMRLSNGVAAAGRYATLAGPSVSSTTLSGVVSASSNLTGATATVTGPACYCTSGTPAALASATCGSTCGDGSSGATYVKIIGKYTYSPIMPGYSAIVGGNLTETVVAQLQ
jgi:Flp pilus assembly protein TadG